MFRLPKTSLAFALLQAARIDAAFPRDTLNRLVEQGGLATEEPTA